MQHISFRRFYSKIPLLKKLATKSTLFVFVFVILFIGHSPKAFADTVFTNDTTSGIDVIKSNNWIADGDTKGASTFDVFVKFKLDGEATSKWKEIYQRVEGWDTGLYYGPRSSGGTFIVRTFESDATGKAVQAPDADGNPADTLITILPQMVASNETIDKTNPAQVLKSFYKYQSKTNQQVGVAETIRAEVETKNRIAPGGYVTMDFWYCPLENYTESSVRPLLIEDSPYADNTPGDVVTGTPNGTTILRSSPTLFPSQYVDYIDDKEAPPCTNLLNAEKNHAARKGFWSLNNPLLTVFTLGANTLLNNEVPTTIRQGLYYRVGERSIYQIPLDATANTAEQTAGATAVSTGENSYAREENFLPSCGVFSNESSIMGCLAQGIYYVIYIPIQWFAALLGNLFDFFLGYSLDDASYRAAFAVKGWKIVRDISNVFFILILVWTGLETVFKTSSNSMKKVVPTLILNALLINFSLFGTRVIIDISNIVTRVFYTSMTVCKGPCEKDADGNIKNPADTVGTYTPLSEKIVSAYNPQKLFGSKTLDQAKAVKNTNAYSGNVGSATNSKDNDVTRTTFDAGTTAGYFIIVELIAAAILFGIAMMFWKVAFMFLGRVVGLYVAMIFAPFAVLTRGGMPLVGGIKELSWGNWFKDLTNYALLAPIFVFFLYIIYSFIQSGFLENLFPQDAANQSFFTTVISIAVPMLILYFMIKQGADIAKDLAGKIGNGIQNFVDKAVGGVGGIVGGGIGLAAGAGAFLGRNVVGRGMRAVTNNTKAGIKYRNWAAANADKSIFAKLNNQLINRTQTGSFDIRNAGVKIGGKQFTAGATINKGFGFLGAKPVDNISGNVGLGQDKAVGKGGKPGGVKKLADEREKKKAERKAKQINYSHLTDDQAKEVWEKKKADAIKAYGEKNWEEHVEAASALKAVKDKLSAAENELVEAKKTTDGLRISRAQRDADAAKTSFNTAKLSLIKEIKDGRAEASKKEAAEEAGKVEVERLDKYGTIKNVSGLEVAMRAEYAEDLRKGSFWLKDGRPRHWLSLIQGAAGGALMAALPGIGTVIGALMVKNATEALLNNNKYGNVSDRATKKLINDAKKSQGRGNPERVLNDKIDELKKKLVEVAKTHTTNKSDKFEDHKTADLENAILQETSNLEDDIAELKKKRDAADRAGDAVTRKKHNYDIKQKQKAIDKLENALDDVERAQEKLDRMKDNKEKKDKDAEKGKSSDKKDDSKPAA